MQRKIWTISNLLSLSRIVLMIPVGYFLAMPGPLNREIAVLIILVAVATDALDGYFARKFDEVSEVGKIIDPLADKIGVSIVVVMLVIFGDIPLWFAGVVLLRDIIIFLAGLYIKSTTGIVLPSLMPGKIAVSFLALYLVLSILKYESLITVVTALLWISVFFLMYSLLVYAQRFFGTLNEYHSKGK